MTDEHSASRDHFSDLVRQWSHFGPPLRPSPDDTAIMQQAVDALERPDRAPCVVVLGLTAEIIGCTWPAGTRLLAMDHSAAMLGALWPPRLAPPGAHAVQAGWTCLPLPDCSVDLVAGDGCYSLFSHPQGFAHLNEELRRILRPGGWLAMRVFTRPDVPETIPDIARDLEQARIGSVHALKLRLLAALHGMSGPGTQLGDVWRAWRTLPAIPASMDGRRGWTSDEVAGIEGYRGLQARYFLPVVAEMRASMAEGFVEQFCRTGSQELGSRCPTFLWIRA